MTTKEKIIQKLEQIDDEALLAEILELLKLETAGDKIYQLTAPEEQAVQEALEDYEAGRVYTSEEAEQKLKEWLKK